MCYKYLSKKMNYLVSLLLKGNLRDKLSENETYNGVPDKENMKDDENIINLEDNSPEKNHSYDNDDIKKYLENETELVNTTHSNAEEETVVDSKGDTVIFFIKKKRLSKLKKMLLQNQ